MATRKISKTEPSNLPKIGAAWPGVEGGVYAGVTTDPKGQLYALVLLADKPASRLNFKDANDWAKSIGATLFNRVEGAMLFANIRDQFECAWYWTSESEGASYAWYCTFDRGYQLNLHKSYEGCARAVRRFPLNPSVLSVGATSEAAA